MGRILGGGVVVGKEELGRRRRRERAAPCIVAIPTRLKESLPLPRASLVIPFFFSPQCSALLQIQIACSVAAFIIFELTNLKRK
jgi:hypothetical protein